MNKLQTIQEFAEYCGITTQTVRRWLNNGTINSYQYKGRGKQMIIRISPEEREKFLTSK